MALNWAEQTRLWNQVNIEMGSKRNSNGTGWNNPNGGALKREYASRLNAANNQIAAQKAAATQRQVEAQQRQDAAARQEQQRQAEIARQEQQRQAEIARQEQLQRELQARQEQLQREAEARQAERLKQMEIGQRTQAANTARSGLESKFQIVSGSKSPQTAGTQGFKRRKLQVNPASYNAISSGLSSSTTSMPGVLNV